MDEISFQDDEILRLQLRIWAAANGCHSLSYYREMSLDSVDGGFTDGHKNQKILDGYEEWTPKAKNKKIKK